MAHWPTHQGYAAVHAPRALTGTFAASWDAKVVTSGAINTKGNWIEIIASTPREGHLIDVIAANTAAAGTDTAQLLDIGIGAAGSEKTLVPNLGVGFLGSMMGGVANTTPAIFRVPLYIPASSRIAARNAGAIAGDTVDVAVDVYGGLPSGGFPTGAGVDTYGVGGSKGVTLTGGTPQGVKGAWAQITASTTNPIKALALSVQGSTNSILSGKHLVDIGVGGAGSEIVVVPDIACLLTNNEQVACWIRGFHLLDLVIPAGSRLACRASNSFSSTADTDLSVHLHGLRG